MSSVQSARWWTPRDVGDWNGPCNCSCISFPERGDADGGFPVGSGSCEILITLCSALSLPSPARPPTASIPVFRASLGCGKGDRKALSPGRFGQLLDGFKGPPALLATRGAPARDRLQDGFRPLAAECPIDVDHKQRRPLAKSGPCANSTRGEYGLVALGEKFVPDPLVHRRRSLSWCAGLFPNPH